MGIPSFYKHLIQTIGGLTSRQRPAPQVFALDLNCAIYHCARNVGEYTHDTRVDWENRLIQHVLGYIQTMVRIVNPRETVYIAVDGVAPMAKIKQQRARRFKSSVLAAEEAAAVGKSVGERWNTNAITPGTAFMERLSAALRGFRIAGVKIVASPADEAGEGEQKIMAWLRDHPGVRDTVVYGLDADLIVLALLEHARSGASVDLFREETEFGGGVKRDALGVEQYLYLHTERLASCLYETWGCQSREGFLRDFVGIMNLLGNDFVPHGMSLKINDGGIETALNVVKRMGAPLLAGRSYNSEQLIHLLEALAAQEETCVLRNIRKKLDARIGGGKDAEARALAVLNDRPVQWAAEKCLVESRRVEGFERPQWFLRAGWRDTYTKEAVDGCDVGDVVAAYCATLTWTLRYYLGEPVDLEWYYPWHLPPLWEDIAVGLRKNPAILEPRPFTLVPLEPVEQLAMVLPRTSFELLPAAWRELPAKYPWAWPTEWSYFSLGRRFLWECEPRIPLISPNQLRSMKGNVAPL